MVRKEFLNPPEAARARTAHLAWHPPDHQRPFPCASGDREPGGLCPGASLTPPHTPHDSGAFPQMSWVTRQGPQSPQQCQSSVRNQARFQSRTVSLQSYVPLGWYPARPVYPPTSKGTALSHHSSKGPLKQQSQATLTQALSQRGPEPG